MQLGGMLHYPVGNTTMFVSLFLDFQGGRYALQIIDRHIFLLARTSSKLFFGGLIVSGFARNLVDTCLTDGRMSENLFGGF